MRTAEIARSRRPADQRGFSCPGVTDSCISSSVHVDANYRGYARRAFPVLPRRGRNPRDVRRRPAGRDRISVTRTCPRGRGKADRRERAIVRGGHEGRRTPPSDNCRAGFNAQRPAAVRYDVRAKSSTRDTYVLSHVIRRARRVFRTRRRRRFLIRSRRGRGSRKLISTRAAPPSSVRAPDAFGLKRAIVNWSRKLHALKTMTCFGRVSFRSRATYAVLIAIRSRINDLFRAVAGRITFCLMFDGREIV